VAKVGTSKAGGTICQQAVVHPWLATDAQQTNKQTNKQKQKPSVSKLYFAIIITILPILAKNPP
jgi:hypothetical protein